MSLTVSKVDKSYGKLKALDEISLCFEPGNIYGLFGRNGAGKSTLCNLMTGRTLPDQGLVHLDGSDLVSDSRIVRRVALVNETWPYPSRRHIRQAFAMAEGFYGDFDWHLAESILKSFALRLTDTFASLSMGQRQVVKDVIGLCLPVEYLILDEPTTGMDAAARERIYSFVLEAYQQRGPTMIIAPISSTRSASSSPAPRSSTRGGSCDLSAWMICQPWGSLSLAVRVTWRATLPRATHSC